MRTTEGHLLDGRLRYAQPADGYRTGIEPVFLAAAIPAQPGDWVLEAGTGAGAGLMCLAARVPGIVGHGVEIDPEMAALARCNITANGLAGLAIEAADILDGAARGPFQHAMANPPWHGRQSTPPALPRRALAKQEAGPGLAGWIAALSSVLVPGGSLTLVLPAATARATTTLMGAHGIGCMRLIPLWPKAGRPAKLAVLTGCKRPGTVRTVPGLVLHEADGRYTAAADSVLRGGGPLPAD